MSVIHFCLVLVCFPFTIFTSQDSIEEFILKSHNKYRALHGVPPLKLDPKLSKHAQEWAEKLAEKGKLEFSGNDLYGENLYATVNYTDAVDSWYKNVEKFNYGSERVEPAAYYFVNIIWKSTEVLGVGVKQKDNLYWVVVNYYPYGGAYGEVVDNVPPPLDSPLASTTSNPKPPKFTAERFRQFVLDAHNSYRERHGVPPLTLDPEITKYAQEWADEMAATQSVGYRPNNKYGENLSRGTDAPVYHYNTTVDSWYKDIKDFRFGTEDVSGGWSFSKMIWKNTKRLGVGVKERNSLFYIAADYDPPGNNAGEYVENVPPPIYPVEFTTVAIRRTHKVSTIPAYEGTKEEIEKEFLDAHNNYRALHGNPPLKLDPNLTQSAQDYATQLAETNFFKHKPDNPVSENLWMTFVFDDKKRIKGHEPVDSWYSEISRFTFGSEDIDYMKTGHFTQVVWKATKFLGLGVARNNESIFVAGHYLPHSNNPGEYIENVPPLIAKAARMSFQKKICPASKFLQRKPILPASLNMSSIN